MSRPSVSRLLICIFVLFVATEHFTARMARAEDDPWADILGDEGQVYDEADEEKFSLKTRMASRVATDLSHDRLYEDHFNSTASIGLEVSYERGRWFKAELAGLGFFEVFGEDTETTRYVFEDRLQTATVTFSSDKVDVRGGYGSLKWGKADLLNPTDVLNPPNVRRFVSEDVSQSKVPNLFLQGSWFYRPDAFVELTVLPIFQPLEASLLGTDWSFLEIPLTTTLSLQPFVDIDGELLRLIREIEPRLIQDVEMALLNSGVYQDDLGEASLGLRHNRNFGVTALSFIYYYGWDPYPALQLDESIENILDSGEINALDFLSLLPSFFSLEELYHRTHVVGGSFETVLGAYTVRGEAAYYTDRTHYVGDVSAIVKPWVWWVIGADRTIGGKHYVNLQISEARVLDADGLDFSQLAEDQWFVSFLYNSTFMNDRLFPELRVVATNTGDSYISPQVRYDVTDRIDLTFGLNVLSGQKDSLFGQFDHNDEFFFLFEYLL